MNIANKILKPLGLVLIKRKQAEDYIANNYILLLLRQFVGNNQILFKDTILGDMIGDLNDWQIRSNQQGI